MPNTRFTRATVPYHRIDGQEFVADYGGLGSVAITNPLNIDENGILVSTASSDGVWTSTHRTGNVDDVSATCDGWTSNLAEFDGGFGDGNSTTADWTLAGYTNGCSFQKHLYCFEQ